MSVQEITIEVILCEYSRQFDIIEICHVSELIQTKFLGTLGAHQQTQQYLLFV